MNDIRRSISFVHLAHQDENTPYKLSQMLSFPSLDIVIREKKIKRKRSLNYCGRFNKSIDLRKLPAPER